MWDAIEVNIAVQFDKARKTKRRKSLDTLQKRVQRKRPMNFNIIPPEALNIRSVQFVVFIQHRKPALFHLYNDVRAEHHFGHRQPEGLDVAPRNQDVSREELRFRRHAHE